MGIFPSMISSDFPSSRRPAQGATADDMAVQMRHSFPGIRTVIEDQTEAGFRQPQLPGDLANFQEEMTQHLMVLGFRFSDPRDRFFRDDQNVLWRSRLDVAKSQHQIILINDGCRDFTRNNLLE